MKKIPLIFLWCFWAFLCQSQIIQMTGNVQLVEIKTNETQTKAVLTAVNNVYVGAEMAGSTKTDVNGDFKLLFVGLEVGTPIEVEVEKHGMKVFVPQSKKLILTDKQKQEFLMCKEEDLSMVNEFRNQFQFDYFYAVRTHMVDVLNANTDESLALVKKLNGVYSTGFTSSSEAAPFFSEKFQSPPNLISPWQTSFDGMESGITPQIIEKAFTFYLNNEKGVSFPIAEEIEVGNSLNQFISLLMVTEGN